MPRNPILLSKESAEKLFNKKATPESYMKPKEFISKKVTELAMSKPVGKVLDSKVGKAGIKVGNVVRRFGRRMTRFPDEGKMNQEQDRKNRANAPVGAVGGTNMGEYRGE